MAGRAFWCAEPTVANIVPRSCTDERLGLKAASRRIQEIAD